jgi:large subunit ribosomal protein L10
MAITRIQKEELVEKLKKVAESASSIVFVNFHGLTVADANTMRNGLLEKGVRYLVAKKTLISRAFSAAKATGDMPSLDGELAIAYSDDAVAAARGIHEFSKKFDGAVSILGGIFEGAYASKDEMKAIATIPPLSVLYGQFVWLINSPVSQFVIALDQIAKKKSA